MPAISTVAAVEAVTISAVATVEAVTISAMTAVEAVAISAMATMSPVPASIMAEALGICWVRARDKAHPDSKNRQDDAKEYF